MLRELVFKLYTHCQNVCCTLVLILPLYHMQFIKKHVITLHVLITCTEEEASSTKL